MRFQTEHCLIRPFEEADIAPFMTYRNNENWMRFQGFKGLSEQAYREALLPPPDPRAGCQLAIVQRQTNRLIGDLYLCQSDDETLIGYTIHPDYARQGYAAEAVSGLVSQLQTRSDIPIHALVEPENEPSLRLLAKLGFRREGTEPDGEIVFTYPRHAR